MSYVPENTPDFDGETYDRERDHVRLTGQLADVFDAMIDGRWHTLSGLHYKTGHPHASISARMRDLRKEKFGGHTIERRSTSTGLNYYKLIVNQGDET